MLGPKLIKPIYLTPYVIDANLAVTENGIGLMNHPHRQLASLFELVS